MLLLAVSLLAVVAGAAEAGLYGYGLLAYVAVPSAFAAFAALRVAGARTSRFTDALFTTPITKGQFLVVQVLVSLSVGFLYLLATLPPLAVHAAHGTATDVHLRFLLAGAGIVVIGTALGTFIGVVFTGRSVTAPVTLAIGGMTLLIAAALFLQRMAPEVIGGRAEAFVRLVHLSPHVHLLGAVGLLGSFAPASPLRAMAAVAILCAGLMFLAFWTFLFLQGIDTWEAGRAKRLGVVLAAAAVVLAPTVVAGTSYEAIERSASGGVAMASSGIDAVLVPRGRPLDEIHFGFTTSNPDTIPAGEMSEMDLVVRLHEEDAAAVRNLVLDPRADEDRLVLEGSQPLALPRLDDVEMDRRAGKSWPVVRVPLLVTPTSPRALGPSAYNVNVTAAYTVEGADDARFAYANFPVFSEVPGGVLHLALASVPLVALCAGGAALRRSRAG